MIIECTMKFLSFLFLFFSYFVYCQNFTSKWFNVDNGLTQNSIKDIVKDQYGFIWLTTENGIIRYDGNNFQHYNIKGLKNIHFKDFQGTIIKDSIIAVNAEEENTVLISGRKAKLINNIPVKNIQTENNFLYRRMFKNLKKVDAFSAYDYYTLKTSKGNY